MQANNIVATFLEIIYNNFMAAKCEIARNIGFGPQINFWVKYAIDVLA